MYTYRVVRIERVLDGDTFDATISLGLYVSILIRIRVADIDAYELDGEHADLGAAAGEFTTAWLACRMPAGLIARTEKLDRDYPVGTGSFGRWAATIVDRQGESLGDALVAAGLAVVSERS